MAAVHPGALATGALQKEEEEEEDGPGIDSACNMNDYQRYLL
jgi:hypothetical protein